jgi:hypothetical protein
MVDNPELKLLKYEVSSWLFALELKLSQLAVFLGSIETAL